MAFTVSLYASLTIFLLGLIYRIYTWFFRKTGISPRDLTTSKRASSAIKGIISVIFSAKIFKLLKAFLLDILFQKRILQESFLRWVMHMLIFWGFMLLLIMHALDSIFFPGSNSTLNPFFFLRDLFGLMVIIGVAIAVFRRFILKVPRLKSNGMDKYAVIILAVIMFSGIFLTGMKITSRSEFMVMVDDYAGLDDEEEVKALESLWVKEFGLVSPIVKGPFEEETLEQGSGLHSDYCADCHSSNKSAFTGYAFAKIISPFAAALDRAGFVGILWYIHFLSCFAGLAYLPFSKMLHIFSTPMSLLANSVMDEETSSPENIATRQIMELDACTHCGTCSLYCSAMMAYEARGNSYILPSEKMVVLKSMAAGKKLTETEERAILEGIYLCTNCDRCTVVCPSGINLKELWINVREQLVQEGPAEPFMLSPLSLVRGLKRERVSPDAYPLPLEMAGKALSGRFDSLIDAEVSINLDQPDGNGRLLAESTFSYCFGCQNCSTVCPVVESYENPQEELGLLPHQIMCCLGLGLTEMASGAKMIWDCLTCYQCQEHCPQNVKVTDILYELKNMAVDKFEAKMEKDDQAGKAA